MLCAGMANANCIQYETRRCCTSYDGVGCNAYSSGHIFCTRCATGYELVRSQEPVCNDATNGNSPVYTNRCQPVSSGGGDTSEEKRFVAFSELGITSYRNYGFYVDVSDTNYEDDDNHDGIFSDGMPILPRDANGDFVWEAVCTGTNFYPENGVAPTCTFDMDAYMQAYDDPDSFTGNFKDYVGNCSGCVKCRNGTCVWDDVGGGIQQKSCYQYQNVPGNYCLVVVSDEYRCAAGYYGTPVNNAGNWSGCSVCMTLAQAGLTVVSNLGDTVPKSTSSYINNSDATGCYVSSGDADTRVVFSDGKGSFYWDNDGDGTCYFSAD